VQTEATTCGFFSPPYKKSRKAKHPAAKSKPLVVGIFIPAAVSAAAATTAAMLYILVVLAGDSAVLECKEQGEVGVDKESCHHGSNIPFGISAYYQIDATPDRGDEDQVFIEPACTEDADRSKDYPADVLDDQYNKYKIESIHPFLDLIVIQLSHTIVIRVEMR
jgi:hypothetical protein